MTLKYLDYNCILTDSEITIPNGVNESLWVSIHWKDHENKTFSLTIEQFPGKSEGEILGIHEFKCANDSDSEWEDDYIINFYDGVHQNIYNGSIEFIKNDSSYRMILKGWVADSMDEANDAEDGQIFIDVIFS